MGELLERKCPTVVMLIGSTATKLDVSNTLKTIKSYESISKMKKTPVIATYAENSEKNSRKDVDTAIVFNVLSLAVLYSRQNHELDSQDLFNWINYNRVTSFNPHMACLTIVDGREITNELKDIGDIISVATVAADSDQTHFPTIPEYQCSGFLPESAANNTKGRCPFNFIISNGIFNDTAARLNTILNELDQVQNARVIKRSIINGDDKATETGMVL